MGSHRCLLLITVLRWTENRIWLALAFDRYIVYFVRDIGLIFIRSTFLWQFYFSLFLELLTSILKFLDFGLEQFNNIILWQLWAGIFNLWHFLTTFQIWRFRWRYHFRFGGLHIAWWLLASIKLYILIFRKWLWLFFHVEATENKRIWKRTTGRFEGLYKSAFI